MTITGKIAAIINGSTLVINRGSHDGVVVGMTFGIKLLIPEISDPDDLSNKLTGLYYTKGKIEVVSVYDKMAIGTLLPIIAGKSQDQMLAGLRPKTSGNPLIADYNWNIAVGDEVYQIEDTPN